MRKKTIWIAALIVLGVCVVGLIAFIAQSMLLLDTTKLNTLKQSTVILDQNGAQAALLSGSEKRTIVALDQVPHSVQSAFIAAEDVRFYRHHGVDFYRIGGALVKNIKTGDYSQGASTITQQLIKLTHLTSAKTLKRKAQEALLALRLEMVLGKDEILEAYLNTVYFGAGAYGIEAASRTYFGVPASELTLAQGALLAGVIKSPSKYAPHLDMTSAVERRNLVLTQMREEDFISQEDMEKARAETVTLVPRDEGGVKYAWYAQQAADEAALLLKIDRETLLSGGYRLYTALDPAMQSSADALFENKDLFPSDAQDGTPTQAALVCASAQNGEVYALIGGRDYAVERGLNRASGMRRQPGSAFKPVSVYAAAVDRFGYLPTSFVDDTQRDFGGGYTPSNVGGKYNGAVTLREALSRSLNVATVDLLSRTSVQAAMQYAQGAGLALDTSDGNLSMALGALTKGVSPMELAAAYAPLANGGGAVRAHLIRKIEDPDGRVLYDFHAEERRVMSPISARLVTDMLITAARSGTAKALSNVAFPVAGKTGTVGMQGGNRDVWTVAYTPKCTLSVWMGFDMPDSAHLMSNATTGSSHPARLAAAFFEKNEGANGGAFSVPEGLTSVLIDQRALEERHEAMLVSDMTPKSHTQQELFPASATPTRMSDVWRAPSRVFDLKAQREEGGTRLTFTAVDSYALYKVYRDRGGEAQVICELSGETGDALSYVDFEDHDNPSYTVVPYEGALLAEGVELSGPASPAVRATDRAPARTPLAPEEGAPIPTQRPLFG